MGAEQGGNRQTAAGIDKEEKTNIVRTYDEEERRKPGERIIKGNMPGGRARGKAKRDGWRTSKLGQDWLWRSC